MVVVGRPESPAEKAGRLCLDEKKTVLEIYLAHAVIDTLPNDYDSTEVVVLEGIAYTPVIVGGEAVYWARAMLKLDVDDAPILLNQYRIGIKEDETELADNKSELLFKPNPTKNNVEVLCSNNFNFELINSVGIVCLKGEKYCKGALYSKIDLKTVPAGIYYLKIMTDGKTEGGKLVVLK